MYVFYFHLFSPSFFYPQCAADTQVEQKQNIARAHAHHPHAKSGGQTLVINFLQGGQWWRMVLVPIDSEKLYLAATLKIIVLRSYLNLSKKNSTHSAVFTSWNFIKGQHSNSVATS